MIKFKFLSILALLLMTVTQGAWAWTNGAMNGQFSVSAVKKVVFSQGNLKYNGSTYSFATNQYDYIGESQTASNKDLFAWQSDYSAISVGGTTGWSALTKAEWDYLIDSRTNHASKWADAKVNDIYGLVLLPDEWTLPTGCSFTAGHHVASNAYTTAQWALMEAAGAVFLPAAGLYSGSSYSSEGTIGYYWMQDAESDAHGRFLYLSQSALVQSYYRTKGDLCSVRLVRSPRAATYSGGTGTSVNPYQISTTTDWNNLVSAVNGGETYSGTYFQMTANVGTVSTWMTGTFSGTFDGDGKTLTVGYSATTNNCAPFGYLNGTVQNLKVAGNISTSKQYAGGLAAWVKSGHTANVTNCRVAATINSTYNGDGSSAGFVAYVDGRLNVTGCAFTGTLAGSNAYAWGGFVSYNVGRSDITNCLFAPASVTAKADYSATVGRNGGGTLNFANFYYTQKFNTAQGIQARTIVKGDGVSSLSVTKGEATATYTVSGITVYSGGIDFNDGSTTTFYGGSGQTVSLALTAETRSGYQFKQYAASQGSLSDQTTNTPTLTMPAANSTANDVVTISAEYTKNEVTLTDGVNLSASGLTGFVGKQCDVSYTRSFNVGKTSTVCLPFAYTKQGTEGSFYEFTSITKEGGEYVATMTEPVSTTLAANTPYLFTPAASSVTFTGTIDNVPATFTAGETVKTDWTFKGTFATIEWTTAPTGTYGFSAQNVGENISQGEFVKVGEYVRIKPMRCYLKYTGEDVNWAAARGMTRAAAAEEQLPETIKVRLIGANGDITAIGTLHTQTGEVELDGWYTLDGTRLTGQPTRKGIYVNNGKKVIIK